VYNAKHFDLSSVNIQKMKLSILDGASFLGYLTTKGRVKLPHHRWGLL
jgi:hypothetical protein